MHTDILNKILSQAFHNGNPVPIRSQVCNKYNAIRISTMEGAHISDLRRSSAQTTTPLQLQLASWEILRATADPSLSMEEEEEERRSWEEREKGCREKPQGVEVDLGKTEKA